MKNPSGRQVVRGDALCAGDTPRVLTPSSKKGRILACVALALYALALLSIGLTKEWQLRHEDNGAIHTTLARSHQVLGLAGTRAHDMFVDRFTREAQPYGHHPPGPALLLAAVFTVTGTDTPMVARLTAITVHIVSLAVLTLLLWHLLGWRDALIGGFIAATIPMSSFFGRMVNYEPFCLLPILLLLLGYVRFHQQRTWGLRLAAAGVILGGLVDWPSFFFMASMALVELIDLIRRRFASPALFLTLLVAAPVMFVFDLGHMAYAAGGIGALSEVLTRNQAVWDLDVTVQRFLLGQVDTFRRFFTDVGLLAALALGVALVRRRTAFADALFDIPSPGLMRRVLTCAGMGAAAYVLAAPPWAHAHQYWQFYFIPFTVLSMVLAWRALERRRRRQPATWLRVVCMAVVAEMLISSAYWLHWRHTRPEAYAIETTAQLRQRLLLPVYLERAQ